MRVLFISDEYSVGGAAKALGEVVLHLKEFGIEAIVCTSQRDELSEFLDSNGIANIADGHLGVMSPRFHKWRLRKPLVFLYRKWICYTTNQKAIKYIKKNVDMKSIDLIHTNSARNDIGCYLHRRYKIPHIIHLREFGQEDFDLWIYRYRYYKYISRNSNKILAVSQAVRNAWVTRGVDAKKCITLYDGIDIKNIAVKDKYDNDVTLRIVFVGGVCETKGQNIAIEAMGLLPDEIKNNIFLDFVGWIDTYYILQLQERIVELGLTNTINFLGRRDDIGNILQEYDIGLNCSKCEGFGRVTAEYMYAGLGVVATDTGASPELIQDGYSGRIFRRDSVQELTDCIVDYYYNRELISEYGRNAHQEANERFSSMRNINDILNVYRSIVKTKVPE